MTITEQQGGLWLYFVCQFATLRRVLRDRAVAPLDAEMPLTFSEKPVNAGNLRYGEVVLVFAREALARHLEPRREGAWVARAAGAAVPFEAGDLVRVFVKDERLLPGIRALYPEAPVAVLKLKGGSDGETTELVDAAFSVTAEVWWVFSWSAGETQGSMAGPFQRSAANGVARRFKNIGGGAALVGATVVGPSVKRPPAPHGFTIAPVAEAVPPRWTDDQRKILDVMTGEQGYDTTQKLADRLGWEDVRVRRAVAQLGAKEMVRSGGGAPGGGWHVELRDGVRDLWTKWLRFGKAPPTDEAAKLTWKAIVAMHDRTTHHDLPAAWKPILAVARAVVKAAEVLEKEHVPLRALAAARQLPQVRDFRRFLDNLVGFVDQAKPVVAVLGDIKEPSWLVNQSAESITQRAWDFYGANLQNELNQARTDINHSLGGNARETLAKIHADPAVDQWGTLPESYRYEFNWWAADPRKTTHRDDAPVERIARMRIAIDSTIEWLHYFYATAERIASETPAPSPDRGEGDIQKVDQIGPWRLMAHVRPGEKDYGSREIADFVHGAKVSHAGFTAARIPDHVIAGAVVLERTHGTGGGYYRVEQDDVVTHVCFDARSFSDVIAHEVGHRIWFKHLGSEARKTWVAFIRVTRSTFTRDQVQAMAFESDLGQTSHAYLALKERVADGDKTAVAELHRINASITPEERRAAGSFAFYFKHWNRGANGDTYLEWLAHRGFSKELPSAYANVDATEAWPEVIEDLVNGGAAKVGPLVHAEIVYALSALHEDVLEAMLPGVVPPIEEAGPEVVWSKLDPQRKGYAKVVSQEKGISDHYICSICRGGFPLNKAGRLEALACCADAKRPVNEAAFDAYAYRNASLLDMVRLLALAADRRPVNMGLIVRLMDRLAAGLELATVAVLGRAQAQTLSGLLRRALANLYDAMQPAGVSEHRSRLARIESALARLEG